MILMNLVLKKMNFAINSRFLLRLLSRISAVTLSCLLVRLRNPKTKKKDVLKEQGVTVQPSYIPWSEINKIQPWKTQVAKKQDELKQQGATVQPSPKSSSNTKKKSVLSNKVIVLGHSIKLQVLRPDNWKDSVQHHVQVNEIDTTSWSYPCLSSM